MSAADKDENKMAIETLTNKQQEVLARISMAFAISTTIRISRMVKVADMRTAKMFCNETQVYGEKMYEMKPEYKELGGIVLAMLQLENANFGSEILRIFRTRTC